MQKDEMKKSKNRYGAIFKKITYTVAYICAFLNFMTITSFADNPLDQAGISGSSGALATMFNFFLAICVPVAIIGLAVSAFSFFLPNEKGWEVAKKRMLHIGLALMVLMLIPSIYKLSGGSAVQNAGWKAGETNSQIISRPAGSGEFDITDGPSAAS